MSQNICEDSDSIFLRLPYMRSAAENTVSSAKIFSPGLPDEILGGWKAANFPLDEACALRLLNEFRKLSLSDLETMRASALCASSGQEIKIREEMANLAAFAGNEKKSDAWEMTRQMAQRALIWLVALEEKLAEIASLEARCKASEAALPLHFGEENFFQGAVPDPEIGRDGKMEAEMLIPWRICVANAAIFIPSQLPILAEGEMLRSLEEYLDFEPAQLHLREGKSALKMANAPLWRILGHTRQLAGIGEELEEVYNIQRVWLGLFNE